MTKQPPNRVFSAQEKELLALIEREEKRLKARENFQDFIEYMMPDPEHYDDPTKTSYVSKPVHKLMVRFWEEISSGKSLRSALSVPPQTGKTLHITVMGVAFDLGKNPGLRVAVGTYNEIKAKDNGQKLRQLLESRRYREVFPEFKLEKGGKSKSELYTTAGGAVTMLGRGSGVTGRPVDLFIIDDPVKDAAEANSTNALEESWQWFSTTAMQRAHVSTRYVIIHTRWAANDLIGHICDPDHPDYDPVKAAPWTYLNVKAYNNDPHIAEILGIKPEDYLWPEKFPPHLLEEIRRTMSPQDFSALYMGKPVPDEGGFFYKDMIIDYVPSQLPKKLRVYAASDHAVSSKQTADYTVLVVAGVDEYGHVWLLDCVHRKMPSDETVEQMIRLMKHWRPITWWAARDHISKSLGPFLKRRMRDEGVYSTHVQDSPEIGNKMQKAQAFRGLMALSLVHFPRNAGWYQTVVNELLRFRGEGDAHDDIVDALGHLGRGIEFMARAAKTPANTDKNIKPFTLAWVQMGQKEKERDKRREKALNGF